MSANSSDSNRTGCIGRGCFIQTHPFCYLSAQPDPPRETRAEPPRGSVFLRAIRPRREAARLRWLADSSRRVCLRRASSQVRETRTDESVRGKRGRSRHILSFRGEDNFAATLLTARRAQSIFNLMVKYKPTSIDAAFSALADPIRRGIVERLARGEAAVGELAEPYNVSAPAISRHLRVLGTRRSADAHQTRAGASLPAEPASHGGRRRVDHRLPPLLGGTTRFA